MYYHVCEYCGAYLDLGESCDCGEESDDVQSNDY